MIRLGVIGYGVRIQGILEAINSLERGAQLLAITDPRKEEICNQFKEKGKSIEHLRFFNNPDEMLDEIGLDGVLIGTRCSLHAQMALKVLARGIPLFLEKPVATNMEELIKLYKVDRSYLS